MNVINAKTIETLLARWNEFQATMLRILKKYRADAEKAREAAEKFKDEDQELARRKTALINTAREEIATAEARFRSAVSTEAKNLRDQINTALIENPAPMCVTRQLRDYREFGVSPSRLEVEALVQLCAGSLPGLAMVNAVLKEMGAGLRVNCTTIADVERDLVVIDKLARSRSHYVPLEFLHEGVEIFGDTSLEVTRSDGFVYPVGTWDSVRLIAAEAGYRDSIEKIGAMKGRLSNVSYPAIEAVSEELEPGHKEASPAATVEETPAEPHRSSSSEAEAAKIRQKFVTEQMPPAGYSGYLVMPPKNPDSGTNASAAE